MEDEEGEIEDCCGMDTLRVDSMRSGEELLLTVGEFGDFSALARVLRLVGESVEKPKGWAEEEADFCAICGRPGAV